MNFDLESCTIYSYISGSHLYGFATVDSDEDIRGVCIPPLNILLSPFQNFEQHESKNPDCCIFSLSKFFKLAADCNPSIIEAFFVPTEFVRHTTDVWQEIVKHRNLFLSTACKSKFCGYAVSQLKRMERHREWLRKNMSKPNREDFGLPTHDAIFTKPQLQAIQTLGTDIVLPEKKELAIQELRYLSAKTEWDQYNTWALNRNKERAVTEFEFGMDCKFAAHTIRLLSMGRELLETGNITLPCPNAALLKDIRTGKYSYEQLLEMVGNPFEEFEELEKNSPLPHKPDRVGIENLYLEILHKFFEDSNLNRLFQYYPDQPGSCGDA